MSNETSCSHLANELVCIQDFVSSAFTSNPVTRKSVRSYSGTLRGCALIHWMSKGQDIVMQLSTKCEYVALAS